jgi:hypothetical protein
LRLELRDDARRCGRGEGGVEDKQTGEHGEVPSVGASPGEWVLAVVLALPVDDDDVLASLRLESLEVVLGLCTFQSPPKGCVVSRFSLRSRREKVRVGRVAAGSAPSAGM